MHEIVIVGAGVSGLATAFYVGRLARSRGVALRITVLEAQSRVGGRIWTERVDGFQIEHAANGFLDSKRSTLELAREIGLVAELITARPEARDRFIFWNGRLHKLPGGPGELLRSGLMSWRGKLRLVAERFVRARRDVADESVHEFATRRIGREAAEVLVDALVTGIHAGDATLLSAPAAFPRMIELERDFGSLLRAMPRVRRQRIAEAAERANRGEIEPAPPASGGPGGTLWSLRGGMGQLIERLNEFSGAEVVRGVAVRRIEPRSDGGWIVRGDGADSWPADAVVLAAPSLTQAAIVEPLDADLARQLGEIQFNSVVVVAFGFRASELGRPLNGFGYLSPQRSRRDVLGVLWSSTIYNGRAPAGMVLVQAMGGGWNRPDIVSWDDDRIVRAVRDELRETMSITATPTLMRIIRWPQAIPQYFVGHRDRVTAIESRRQQHERLYLTGNSFRGVSVNDCVEEAARCAAEIVGDLTSTSSATPR